MKHYLLKTLLMAAVLAVVTTVDAKSTFKGQKTVDGFTYYMFKDNETGEDYARVNIEWNTETHASGHYTMLSQVTGDDGVTYPCTKAELFFELSGKQACPDLTRLTFPDSYTSILVSHALVTKIDLSSAAKDITIRDCHGLTGLDLPEGLTKIIVENNDGLTELDLPEGMTIINSLAYNRNLARIGIPSSVQELGSVSGCSSLETLSLPPTMTSIAPRAFYRSGLKSITIPKGITVLQECFLECEQLEEVVIGDDVETLLGAFDFCKSLKRVTFGTGLKTIGDFSFRWTAIEEMDIPDHVTLICQCAFASCRKLKRVHLGKGITSLEGPIHEYYTPYVHTTGYIFSGCDQLEEVTAENAITVIGDYVFGSCTLSEIPFGNRIETIGKQAFFSTPLVNIVLPGTVKSIGDEAFGWSPYMSYGEDVHKAVYSYAANPPTLGSDVFTSQSLSRPLYVPRGRVQAYRNAAGWDAFTDIHEMDVPTSIDAVTNDNTSATGSYTLDGRHITTLQHGVNIVNGRKVIVK